MNLACWFRSKLPRNTVSKGTIFLLVVGVLSAQPEKVFTLIDSETVYETPIVQVNQERTKTKSQKG